MAANPTCPHAYFFSLVQSRLTDHLCPSFHHPPRFTIILAVLITYGVGMLFTISLALNDPYGFDPQDIKLNRLCAGFARDILVDYSCTRVSYEQLADPNHDTPPWLEQPPPAHLDPSPEKSLYKSIKKMLPSALRTPFTYLKFRSFHIAVVVGVIAYLSWCSLIVILSWGLSIHKERGTGTRWWDMYVPVTSDTEGYISLGIFLLLGFWMNDAYGRYWRGLQIWETEFRPKFEHATFLIATCFRRGLWHQRDRERLLAHLAAFPFAVKQTLRSSRDTSELVDILSRKDLQMLSEAPRFTTHILNVIHAYVNEADARFLPENEDIKSTFGASVYTLQTYLPEIESKIGDCDRLRKYPISPAFTAHLRLFTMFWLALLPLYSASHDGFLSFIYLVPIGYSIIKLLNVGRELADPFGNDVDDIPLDLLCQEMKNGVHHTYHQTLPSLTSFLGKSNYNGLDFTPKARNGLSSRWNDSAIGIRRMIPAVYNSVKHFVWRLPPVPFASQATCGAWSIFAVFLSWWLSRFWDDDRQDDCIKWCSPIDVDGDILANIGFAVFLILLFRASDGMDRYDEGALTIYNLQMDLKLLAVEAAQAFPDGGHHEGAKKRIVAHVVQIPLCFRDILLDISRCNEGEKEGVLTDDDRKRCESSPDQIDFLLKTVESYFISSEMPERQGLITGQNSVNYLLTLGVTMRIGNIRSLISRVLTMKRFPIIKGYTRHQRRFTALWLALLPLAMTRQTGFYTILWAQVISYGVFSLDAIAASLVDPYGHDATDLPVGKFFSETASAILEAVSEVRWDCDFQTRSSGGPSDPHLGVELIGQEVFEEYTVAQFNLFKPRHITSDHSDQLEIGGPRIPMMKASLYSHLRRSVPFWWLLGVSIWISCICALSYVTRDRSLDGTVPWWTGSISVSTSVAKYVSFGTFTTLGFFVRAAFKRYHLAGSVWGDHLRGSCHSLASQFLSYFQRDELHNGDHKRVISYIATLPLVLKSELRGSRDIRELKGLLSFTDLGHVQCAESMSGHCLSVVRSYFLKVLSRQGAVQGDALFPDRIGWTMQRDLMALEQAVQLTMYLNQTEMAPGFSVLVKILLAVWFFIVPFVVSEVMGWFTLLWGPVFAFGLFGLFQIGVELQNPFGRDLNDLDLDTIAGSITADVLSSYHAQPDGFLGLVHESEVHDEKVYDGWHRIPDSLGVGARCGKLFCERDMMSQKDMFLEGMLLAFHGVHWALLVATVAWSVIAVGVAYLVSKYFPHGTGNADCPHWFCSPIAVQDSVKTYIGFALFFLLAYRLNDSHARYVYALVLWQEGLIGTTRTFTNRLFALCPAGWWHEGDVERIAGHVAAFAICLVGSLRKQDCQEKLRQVLGEEDVHKILSTTVPSDYCIDVVRSYLLDAERRYVIEGIDKKCSGNELTRLMLLLRELKWPSLECRQMQRFPLPFGYVQHLRIFLFIWLVVLPLSLVEDAGWVAILWTVIISYGIIGVETWSEELSDPFGYDVSDIPLENLCRKLITVVKHNLNLFRHGLRPFIQDERKSFPVHASNYLIGKEP